MKEQILAEIKRIAATGKVPGWRAFANETGFREYDWRGVHWARWSDALKEAGLEPNKKNERFDTQNLFPALALVCRAYGKMPTYAELLMYRRKHPGLPDYSTIRSHFGSTAEFQRLLRKWALVTPEYADVAALIPELTEAPPKSAVREGATREGHVYLIKSGAFYKIGRGDELERRVKQIRVSLPDKSELVHSIRTDDPPGIEAYWHRRFDAKRANGEWFKLLPADVAAFRRRTFQ